MSSSADVVICGAGIAGASAAYHLAVRQRIPNVVIVDEREPLTLTSNRGTQAYRNWWPGPDDTMLKFVSRSIDLLEESAVECGNAFRLSRHGYLFVTADEAQAAAMESTARDVSAFGMGPLRIHRTPNGYLPAAAEGFADEPTGADLLLGDELHAAFPYLMPDAVAGLHVRRAGWLSAVALGDWFLTRAAAAGARFIKSGVTKIHTDGGRVRGVRLASGERIDTERVVLSAGPALPSVARLLDLELPVFHELHSKMTFRDTKGVVPREAPYLILTDPVRIDWTDAERRALEAHEDTRRFTELLPGGVHVRPVDLAHGDELYFIWTFENDVRPYVWPPTFNTRQAEVLLRGFARLVPGMASYSGSGSLGGVDGGYYCKTPENRPLIGPLAVEGAYVLGALSGVGVMSAHAAGELLSLHVAGQQLPDYARWFLPSRYDDPNYKRLMDSWNAQTGQL